MKNFMLRKMLILFFPVLLMSCNGLPASNSQSWHIRENNTRKNQPTLAFLGVQIDMTSSRDSIEREFTALAPLYFWNRKCAVIPSSEKPEYAAKVFIRERNINRGWKTKKSLVVEVHIWTFEDVPNAGTPIHERKTPIVVGRTTAIGEKSFSSSKISAQMLSKTIRIAARKLAVHKRQNQDE